MSEERYNVEHLQDYMGILTSHDIHNENFIMELKVEHNPVLKRWAEKNESSIELEFSYNVSTSTAFYHNRNSCPLKYSNKCPKCKDIKDRHYKFEANLGFLQVGDTFKIKAALMNNDRSVLPAEIHNFENYQPLLAACTEYPLRLDDTPEGINKKQQRLQEEREAEEKRKEDEKKAQKDANRKKRNENIQQFFRESPYITQIIVTAIGSVIAGVILTTIFAPIPSLFKYIYSLIFQN